MSSTPDSSPSLPARSAVAWAALPSRGMVRATGRDAAAFLDKFSTAAIAPLEPGTGTEGMFTDVRGWVIALTAILRTADGVRIDCEAAVAARLREHLEHYHIREDFELVDASADEHCVAVVGPEATRWLTARIGDRLPAKPLQHATVTCGGIEALVVAVDWFGVPGFLLRVANDHATTLHAWLAAEGLPRASDTDLDTLRIEQRLPWAADIPEKTLPQELDRTARAISFTKGCYLGQETVARIDALGHVNRTLALVAVEGAGVPPPGTVVSCGGEPVGTLTSSCASPRLGACGLALVHRRGLEPASALTVAGRSARLIHRGATSEA